MVNPYFVHSSVSSHLFSAVSRLLFVPNGWLIVGCWLLLGLTVSIGQNQPATTDPSDRPARRGVTGRRQQAVADSARADARRRAIARADSAKQAVQDRNDSLRALRSAGRRPTVNWPDRRATRFSERPSKSPFILRDPKGVSTDFRLSPDGRIAVTERVRTGVSLSGAPTANSVQGRTDIAPAVSGTIVAGTNPPAQPVSILPPSQFGLPYRPAETIPFSTFNQLQTQGVEKSLWHEYSAPARRAECPERTRANPKTRATTRYRPAFWRQSGGF